MERSSNEKKERDDLRRKNHYVPQGYLGFFSIAAEEYDEKKRGLIYVYDSEPGYGGVSRRARESSIAKEVAIIRNYNITSTYEFDINSIDDLKLNKLYEDDFLEKEFGFLETKTLKVIQELRMIRDGVNLSIDDRTLLSIFIALSYVRTPSFIEGLVGPFRHAAAEKYEKEGDFSALRLMLASTDHHQLLELIPKIAERISQKRWQFYIPADGMAFITCDTPVHHKAIGRSSGINAPWKHEQEILIPLRRDLALKCSPGPEVSSVLPFRKFTKQQTRFFYKVMARTARRYVYAGFKSPVLTSVVFKERKYSQEFFK